MRLFRRYTYRVTLMDPDRPDVPYTFDFEEHRYFRRSAAAAAGRRKAFDIGSIFPETLALSEVIVLPKEVR